jgi:hypothetical protein
MIFLYTTIPRKTRCFPLSVRFPKLLHIANYAAFVAYAGALWISLKSRFLLLLLSVKMSPLSVACSGDASSRCRTV